MKPSAIIHNDSLDSALMTTQNIANCLLHNNNNNCRHPSVHSSTTLLSSSPSTSHRFQRSSYKNTSKKYASFISEKRSTASPSNAYKSHVSLLPPIVSVCLFFPDHHCWYKMRRVITTCVVNYNPTHVFVKFIRLNIIDRILIDRSDIYAQFMLSVI
ncbi:unnamed protein product [Trichobilharzia regenti]|nr:unnamed protein product [Trichobilharzia regenti]